MGPSRPWRRQLLGTLQGQLQLATYLAVFVGFTGASIAGLWIGQRNLIDSTRRDLNQSAQAIQTCLREAGDQPQLLRQELLLHSNLRRQLWINGHNDTFYQLHGGACIPNVVWTQTSYILSNPDAWLYDINNYNGFGIHLDY